MKEAAAILLASWIPDGRSPLKSVNLHTWLYALSRKSTTCVIRIQSIQTWMADERAIAALLLSPPSVIALRPIRIENGWVGVQNFKFSGYMTVCRLCMHDFCARASAPWKIFCCLLKFLLKKCYKCRVGSEKSESRGVGWLIEPRSLLGGAFKSPHAVPTPE